MPPPPFPGTCTPHSHFDFEDLCAYLVWNYFVTHYFWVSDLCHLALIFEEFGMYRVCVGGGGRVQGDGNLGVMGVRSLREAGEEGLGGGIPRRGGNTIFHNRKSTQRWEPLRKGTGTGSTWHRKWEVALPLFPLHVFIMGFLRNKPWLQSKA